MQRFAQACRQRNYGFRTLDVLEANLVIHAQDPQVWAHGTGILPDDVDLLVPRIGTAVTEQGCAAVAQFEAMGVPVLNRADAIARARDKLRALQALSGERIPVPNTVVVRGEAELSQAIGMVGGLPCILKLLEGTQGVGVMLAESREALEAILQAFWSLGHTVLLQEFVSESKGRDVRAFVVGDRVVGAMRRQAKLGEFRSNIHRGGVGKAVRLSPDEEAQVVRAAKVMGLDVAGVDYLESRDGPKIIEVNASPGFQGLEEATGADIAGAILDYGARRVREARA